VPSGYPPFLLLTSTFTRDNVLLMLPQEYTPVFDDSFYVFETDPETKAPLFLSGINAVECLTEKSAQDLVKVLAAGTPAFTAVIVDMLPKGQLGGPFQQSGTVPWLKITQDGVTITENAGMLANFYNHSAGMTGDQLTAIQQYYDGRCRAAITELLAAAKGTTS